MSEDYEVGRGNPPKHTRFKKGKSGNPKGRPKGTKNLKTDLEEELRESVLLKEGSVRKKISKQRAMLKATVAKALKGDVRAAETILKLIDKLLDEEVSKPEQPLTKDETNLIDLLTTRAVKTKKTEDNDDSWLN